METLRNSMGALRQHPLVRWITGPAALPILLSVLYFLLQFTQIDLYGATWDEPLHRNWGKLFFLFWKSGDRAVIDLMPGHGGEYGPIAYIANEALSEWLYRRGLLTFVAANHILTLIVASSTVGLTFVLGRMIGGIGSGLLSVFFLVFFPQFLAHSHYNPKDIPLMMSVLLTGILFLRALRTGKRRSFVAAAVAMGLSIALKISAVIMAPVFVIAYVVWLVTDPRSSSVRSVRRQSLLLLSCALAALLSAYAFWPTAWGDPSLILRSVRFFARADFWTGQVLFFGTQYGGADLPWFYTAFEFFAAMPVLWLLSFLSGVVLAVSAARRRDTDRFFLLTWIIVPLLLSMKPHLVRYDGIRQFFFLLPPMCVLAAGGAMWAGRQIRLRFGPRAIQATILLALALLTREVALLHPFEGSYRNEFLRVLYPENMDEEFQIEYWGASYLQGMEWLTDHAVPDPVICVPIAGALIEWYERRPDFMFDCDLDADYIMFFTRYTRTKELRARASPVFTISRMNSPLLMIYRVDASIDSERSRGTTQS